MPKAAFKKLPSHCLDRNISTDSSIGALFAKLGASPRNTLAMRSDESITLAKQKLQVD